MRINKKDFKRDFNEGQDKISNDELIKKYGFSNFKECLKYAQDNKLIVRRKCEPDELNNLKGISDFLKIINKEVLK